MVWSLLCAGMLLGSPMVLRAQTTENPPPSIDDNYRVGLKTGMSLYDLNTSGNGYSSTTGGFKPGFIVGGFFDFLFAEKRFALGTEISLIQKGDTENGATLNLNYIQFPLLFKAYFGSKEVQPYVLVGGGIDVCAGASASSQGQSANVSSSISSIDGSLITGVGLDYQHFRFELRTDYGLGDVEGPVDGNLSVASLGFNLAVGYYF